MDRVALLVDAGYLCTGGGCQVAGREVRRHEVNLDVERAYSHLEALARDISGLPLLRIYWYDGALGGRLSVEQLLLAQHANVKLRLGIVNGLGQQKEVDTKIVTDIAELARNRAIADAVLLGGDGDLRLGVELAQQFGVRVHLLTVEGCTYSESLRLEADSWDEIPLDTLRQFLTVNAPQAVPGALTVPPMDPEAPPISTPSGFGGSVRASSAQTDYEPVLKEEVAATLGTVVVNYISALDVVTVNNLAALLSGQSRSIPADHDRPLLWQAGQALAAQLDAEQKRFLRAEFRKNIAAASR